MARPSVRAGVLLAMIGACTPASPAPETRSDEHAESRGLDRPTSFDSGPRTVQVDGVDLHYVEAGTGTPVVLIHGSLADYTYWQWSDQLEPLSEGHRVIAYSRRYNHPNSNPQAASHSPMVEAQDLAGLVERLGLAPVHLVGHSYGAYTALAYALEHPERVRSLVLAEPPIIPWLPDIVGGEGIFEGFMERVWGPLGKAFEAGGVVAGLDFTAHWYFGVPFEEVSPEWQALFDRNVDEWRALAISPHAFPKLDYARVSALDVPTLLLSGEQNSGGMNDLIDRHLERLLPDVERVVIAGASHEMFLDDPRTSTEAISDFFRRHPGPVAGRPEQ